MDTLLILMNTGVPAIVAGIIPMLQAFLLEATAQAHGVILIAMTSVPTMMVLTVTTAQHITLMDHTLLTAVGEIAQENTAQLVLEVKMQQATGSKIVLKLEVITKVHKKVHQNVH
jgi:hypothetical protein